MEYTKPLTSGDESLPPHSFIPTSVGLANFQAIIWLQNLKGNISIMRIKSISPSISVAGLFYIGR